MLDNFYTLRAVSRDLDRTLRGQRLGQPFSQEKDEIVFPLLSCPESLVVSCRPRSMACFLHPAFARARKNTAEVLGTVRGGAITRFLTHPSDRVLEVRLADPSVTLVIRLFTGRANVFVIDGTGTVKDAFRGARKAVGELSPVPSGDHGEGASAIPLLAGRWTGRDVASAIRVQFPQLGPHLTAEVLHRARVPAEHRVEALSPDQLSRISAAYSALLLELEHPSPRIYERGQRSSPLVSLVPLSHLDGLRDSLSDDLHGALRLTFYRRLADETFLRTRRSMLMAIRSRVDRGRRSLEASLRDAAAGSRADEYEGMGHAVLAHLHELAPGATDLVADGRVIPLDPSIPPARQAQRMFERAKKARTAEQESAGRVASLKAQLDAGEELIRLLQSTGSGEQIKVCMKEHGEKFEAFGLGPKSRERAGLPFRTFIVDGGFEVWAGKNSASNDLLTMRHARQHDLWFHARGAGGSHVVLRVSSASGEPGKRAREQAAAIAAYYSKMRKAKTVPVAVTLRKYVRKPRGASPGTVAIERESVLFVQPALPPPETPGS